MKVLVTGASGFVGGAVIARMLAEPDLSVRAAFRRSDQRVPGDVERVVVGGLTGDADWSGAVRACGVVIHAAARVHMMRESSVDPLEEFRAVNVAGTLRLATEAARAGVRRFIFISSIKVNGEETPIDRPFTEADPPSPADPYGVSKLEAEVGLRQTARELGMELVIIRPVLVYGPGVGANFQSMMSFIRRGFPLPFGAINNLRSLVAVENLADLVVRTIRHPAAVNQTLLVSDGDDVSTPELIRRTAAALGKRPILVPVPPALLRAGTAALRRPDLAMRLTASLRVDITRTRVLLDWTPPVGMADALAETARYYLDHLHG